MYDYTGVVLEMFENLWNEENILLYTRFYKMKNGNLTLTIQIKEPSVIITLRGTTITYSTICIYMCGRAKHKYNGLFVDGR